MDAAIDRIMQTYALLANSSSVGSDEARAKVTDYITTLFEAGEKDPHRLTVCGLTYLRELDGNGSGQGWFYRALGPSFRSRINRARSSAAAISERLRYPGWMRGLGLKIAGRKMAR